MIKGLIVTMSKTVLTKANTDDTGRHYESESQLEFVYVQLANLLEIEDSWVSRQGSALDEFLKIDVVIEEEQDKPCLVFQVKSSESGADKHQSLKEVQYQSRTYSVPPILVPDQPLKVLLEELSLFTGIPIKQEIQQLLALAKAYKGKSLPASMFKPTQMRAIEFLQLGKVQGGLSGTIYF